MTVNKNNRTSPTAAYETLYAQLQAVVSQLESGELPLEEALKLFERGTQLAARCQQLLDGAELRVQQLQGGAWNASGDQ